MKGLVLSVVLFLAIGLVSSYYAYVHHKKESLREGVDILRTLENGAVTTGGASRLNQQFKSRNYHWTIDSIGDNDFQLRCYFWHFRDSWFYDSSDNTWRLDEDR